MTSFDEKGCGRFMLGGHVVLAGTCKNQAGEFCFAQLC